jgi:hypothetical protein
MDFLVTLVSEIIYLIVLNSIGASIRWIFNRKRTLKELMDDKPSLAQV